MTCNCPLHGFQLCCLLSPDLLATGTARNPSDLVLVTLYSHYESKTVRECIITISPEFAKRFKITDTVLDYCSVVVDSDWYGELGSLCWGCYCQRWPELVAQFEDQTK
jgi:hypothetical protein